MMADYVVICVTNIVGILQIYYKLLESCHIVTLSRGVTVVTSDTFAVTADPKKTFCF